MLTADPVRSGVTRWASTVLQSCSPTEPTLRSSTGRSPATPSRPGACSTGTDKPPGGRRLRSRATGHGPRTPPPEHDDLSNWPIPCFGCIGGVGRFILVKDEFTRVPNRSASTIEHSERAPIGPIVKDCAVPRNHALIAALALAGVVETAVGTPAVEVPMLFTRFRIGEDEDVRGLGRRPDTSLTSTTKDGMELFPAHGLARPERPGSCHSSASSARDVVGFASNPVEVERRA
jgi:hypothetical protein